MIRLSKDKYLYNYTIDEKGTIRDDAGAIINISFNCERPSFMGAPIHRIMMYTFYGYKENYVIHHIDGNKFNNNLNNLIYLTRAEHARLHATGKHYCLGKHHNEEAKRKIGAAANFTGHNHTEETKIKIRNALKLYYANRNK